MGARTLIADPAEAEDNKAFGRRYPMLRTLSTNSLSGHGNAKCMKWSATAAAWFSSFLLKPLLSCANRFMDIRIVRFWRSTYDVEMYFRLGSPVIVSHLMPRHLTGLYRF